jgi:hypothetical protein
VSGERRNVPAVVEAVARVKASSLCSTLAVPATIADVGEHAARRFLEYFAANIRNKNTRMAYYRAVCSFFAWVTWGSASRMTGASGASRQKPSTNSRRRSGT